MTFRTRIKELRARYDLTQDDLARKVGVRRETILELAHEVARVLKTTIDDLFIFKDEEENTNHV
jgi:putative transcriptional regulator